MSTIKFTAPVCLNRMPRKSQEAMMTVAGSVSASAQQELVTEGIENFELPQSLVTSIARSALPPKAKLSRDTVLALLKGSTAFVSTLAGSQVVSAHDIAVAKQHKSITGTDVLKALETLGLGDMVENIQVELQAYREQAKTQAASSSRRGSVGASVSTPLPSIRIKPPRPPTQEETQDAAQQWDAHLKMYSRKGKAPVPTSPPRDTTDSDVQMSSEA
ncbi:hypothetical protein BDZ89DRAFT_1164698 [Hymenopellis radicata]|nr:hypothetical protein BDZ89DRAFT_1164698 [Hymenopellis radicata]